MTGKTTSEKIGNEAAVEKEPTQHELELAKAAELVTPLAKAGKSEDEMVVVLINEGGFPFKKAARLMQMALEDMGVRLSSKDRYSQVSEMLLKNDFAPKEWDEVHQVCVYLAEEIDATTEKQAMVAVKKFAKEQDIELPDKPKGIGIGSSFRAEQIQWSKDNVSATDTEFSKWCKKQGDKGKTTGEVNYYLRIHSAIRWAFEAGQEAAAA